MKVYKRSFFKNETQDLHYFEAWINKIENVNKRKYERILIETSLGKAHIWGINTNDTNLNTLVVFPGARTTALFWDLDKGLDNLNLNLRIFMVETNGLPNFSDGSTPNINTLEYGLWATEIFNELKIDKAFIAGASFGGLICMKMALVSANRIKTAFLLNPGCLQPFSLSLKNLYFNILPIVLPTENNVRKFLNAAIFCKPTHMLSDFAEQMLVDYEVFAIRRYKDNTQKPYFMKNELEKVTTPTYLILGDKDLLFPSHKSIANAKELIKPLKEIKLFRNVGHGIETYKEAMLYIGNVIKSYQ
ncbi:MAG: alpha/beta hydrolase [Cyclobacteriaceae bacterium]|jgi:pimeloyl-ACP methyl ester carboxylesterase|nr:alpha/beta hydrolase [Cytophagales bacterium]MCZ8326977.1 alpha/beta hydrolase [Cyclobacteriaceae bacterium]